MFIPSSLYMLYLFCTLAKTQEDLWNAWIYGVSLIILFSVSTLYHCSCFTPYRLVRSVIFQHLFICKFMRCYQLSYPCLFWTDLSPVFRSNSLVVHLSLSLSIRVTPPQLSYFTRVAHILQTFSLNKQHGSFIHNMAAIYHLMSMSFHSFVAPNCTFHSPAYHS